jgi:hypothetical protein
MPGQISVAINSFHPHAIWKQPMSKTNNGGGAPGRKKSGAEYRAAHRETSASHVARKQAEGLTRRSIWIPEERTVDLQLFAIFLRHQPAGSPIP